MRIELPAFFERDHGAVDMVALMGGMDAAPHCPVLLNETMALLQAQQGGLFVDATLGLGGHSEAMLLANESSQVIGIDRDPQALQFATKRLAQFGTRFRAVQGNYKSITAILDDLSSAGCRGVLADLGVSSLQLDTVARGFSFREDAVLDMRMDPTGTDAPAFELLEELPEQEIARIIYEYGEERRSRKIARWIVERRERGEPIRSTRTLAELVARAVGYSKASKVHPATRTFQALRIAVNQELDGLAKFIEDAVGRLDQHGRLVIISFHSLEDRIVKQTMRKLAGTCQCDNKFPTCVCGARREVEVLTRRPLTPSQVESDENPRARSAKLRACQKL
jgi:16S rRNA (cytosine1402-N4)-methyltransferase